MTSARSYAVIGSPIDHSLSPAIHQAFAAQVGISLTYDRIEGIQMDFECQVRQLAAHYQGLNVTLPFKERAYQLANRRSLAADLARAANVLSFGIDGILADNTDGIGLVTDLSQNFGVKLDRARVLLLGAGGAVRGAVPALLAAQAQSIIIYNRTRERAEQLVAAYDNGGTAAVSVLTEDNDRPFDVIINGTSVGLKDEMFEVRLPERSYHDGTFIYDMCYGQRLTPYGRLAQRLGLAFADGYGMLVEQAAQAFYLWHGVMPDTRSLRLKKQA